MSALKMDMDNFVELFFKRGFNPWQASRYTICMMSGVWACAIVETAIGRGLPNQFFTHDLCSIYTHVRNCVATVIFFVCVCFLEYN